MYGLPSLEYFSPSSKGRMSPDIQSLMSCTPSPKKHPAAATKISRKGRNSTRHSNSSSVNSTLGDLNYPPDGRESLSRMLSGLDLEELRRSVEDSGSESDSSLDLHTPFAHIMFRDGYISPRSKIMTQLAPAGRGTPSSRHSGSESKFRKDERDTIKRRMRHRDGKLLKEGLGLTTGLGWSDSEDEGVPSTYVRKSTSSRSVSRMTSTPSLSSTTLLPKVANGSGEAANLYRSASVLSTLITRSSASLPVSPSPYKPLADNQSISYSTIPRSSISTPNTSSLSSLQRQTSGYRQAQLGRKSSIIKPLLLDPHRTINDIDTTTNLPRPIAHSEYFTSPPGVRQDILAKPLNHQSDSSEPRARSASYNGQKQQSRVGTSMMYKRSTSMTSVISEMVDAEATETTPSFAEDEAFTPPSPHADVTGVGIAI